MLSSLTSKTFRFLEQTKPCASRHRVAFTTVVTRRPRSHDGIPLGHTAKEKAWNDVINSASCTTAHYRGFSTEIRKESNTNVLETLQYDSPKVNNDIGIPQQVASLMAKYIHPRTNAKYVPHKISILDASAGKGDIGMALREHFTNGENDDHGDDEDVLFLVGADHSKENLFVAKSRDIYNVTMQLDLEEPPFCHTMLSKAFLDACNAHSVNIFDGIVCCANDNNKSHYDDSLLSEETLREFCRWVKPGGYIGFTTTTDKNSIYRTHEAVLEQEGLWTFVEQKSLGKQQQLFMNVYQKTYD